MPNRKNGSALGYRYGFNGQEKDDEIAGENNDLDFGARIYDARLGRWMSTDPLEKKYPGISTYSFSYDSPIAYNDPDGKSGRLTVNQETRTIVLEQTVFLYGKDAVPGSAEAMNKSYANAGATTRIVTDKNGQEWSVTIKITYNDVNAEVLNTMTESNGKTYSQTSDVNTNNIVGFQEGDYILKVDNSIATTEGGESGHTGGIAGRNSTAKTKVHEPFHGFGFVDAPGSGVILDSKPGSESMPESQFFGGNHDVMQWGGSGYTGGWDIKDRHYFDLFIFVKNNIKENVKERVMKPNEIISKQRNKLSEKEENKIKSRVKSPQKKKKQKTTEATF